MSCLSVVLRCQDVCITVPLDILTKESSICNDFYDSDDDDNDAFDDALDDDTTDEIQNIKRSLETRRKQVDLFEVKIKGYNKESIRILFEYLKGNSMALDDCNEIQVLVDMMIFCNKYDITSLTDNIEDKIQEIGFNMENLLQILLMLDTSGSCHHANKLYKKCVEVAKQNLDSQQKVVQFLLDNESNSERIIRLYEALSSDCWEMISIYLDDVTEMGQPVKSERKVIRDTPFHIEVQTHRWIKGVRKIGLFLRCDHKDANFEDWMINCKFCVYSCREDVFSEKIWFPETDAAEIGFEDFMDYNDLLDIRNGYLPMGRSSAMFDVTILCKKSTDADTVRMVVSEDNIGFVDVIDNQFFLTHLSKEEKLKFFLKECGMWCDFCGDDHFIPLNDNKKGVNVRPLDNSVIIGCDDVIVAIPKQILIQESRVFKAMLSNTWTGPDPEDESSEDDDDTNVIKPLKRRVEVVEITEFSAVAVRAIFEWLKGHTEILTGINSFSELLMLCDFYAIDKPINVIVLEIIELRITMDNILEAFATAKELEAVVAYKDVARDMIARCVAFVRRNLGCWVSTLDFIIRSLENTVPCLQLLQVLRDETETCVRIKLEDFSKNKCLVKDDEGRELASCPVHMFRGATWTVSITQNRIFQEDFLGYNVVCDNHGNDTWKCDVIMEFRFYNWKTGNFEDPTTSGQESISGSFTGESCNDDRTIIAKPLKAILDESNDTVLVEVKITHSQE